MVYTTVNLGIFFQTGTFALAGAPLLLNQSPEPSERIIEDVRRDLSNEDTLLFQENHLQYGTRIT